MIDMMNELVAVAIVAVAYGAGFIMCYYTVKRDNE